MRHTLETRRPGTAGPGRVFARSVIALLAFVLPVSAATEPRSGLASAQPNGESVPPVVRCEGGPIELVGDVGRAARIECAAATFAYELMGSFGATLPDGLTVELVRSIDVGAPGDFAGAYRSEGRRIRVLDLASFLSQPDYFGLPTTESLHGAIVAHEVSHAIVDAHLDRASASALEYVGAVVTMSWLQPSERQALIDLWPTPGYRSEDEISIVFYAMSPARFQIKVWKHFSQPGVGAAFVRDILDGRALRHDGGDL